MKRRNLLVLFSFAVFTFGLTPFASAQESSKAKPDAEGFVPIFDGETLKGWEGQKGLWTVRDGAITGQTTEDKPIPQNTFLIWRREKLEDFELRLKFRIVGGNSGIQYRSKELDDFVVSGYQADIDSGDKFIGILYDEKGRGILCLRGKKVVCTEDGKLKEVGAVSPDKEILDSIKKEDWNDYTIIARGNHLVQKINGRTTIDFTDNDASQRDLSGILAIQLHRGPPMLIQLKEIRLKKF